MMYNDRMEHYEFLIAGVGGAGLGLADALLDRPNTLGSILVVDKDLKNQNDRTWCFWGLPSAPYSSLAAHSWQKISILSESYEKTIDLGEWRYWMVRGIDFYRSIRRRLEETPTVHFKLGSVDRIEENGQDALVTVAGEKMAAHWVFDSILRPQDQAIDTVHYHSLKQHFKGWEIETDRDIFDPARATLFDFRTPQKDNMRFIYVLPFSPRQALVEYTIFSANLLPTLEYEAALKDYLGGVLGLSGYRVLSEENGIIPMTDQPFRRQASPHVLNIGTKGGLVKPSSGYAFARMQRDALAIAASLDQFGHPFAIPRSPTRYRLYDSILLQLMYRRGRLMKSIFTRLFERNPIQRIFHFLDEDASLWQDAALIASLPPAPFLGALLKLVLTRRA